MSSQESERRRSRGGSDSAKRSDRSPRHFRDDKTRVKKTAPAEQQTPEEPISAASEEEAALPPAAPEEEAHDSAYVDKVLNEAISADTGSADKDSADASGQDKTADAPQKSAAQSSSSSSSSTHHHHHHHRSHGASAVVDSLWGADLEGEQGWAKTAYSNTKKIKTAHREPDVVAPVEQEKRVNPEKMASAAEPETSFDYVAPKQTYSEYVKNPKKSSTHSGKTKTASREEIEAAEEGFVFRSLSESDKKNRKHRRHHHHHHHHSDSGHTSGSGSEHSGHSSEGESGSSSSSSKKRRRHRHHHRRIPKWLKIVLIVLGVLLLLALLLYLFLYINYKNGEKRQHDFSNISMSDEKIEEKIVIPTEKTGKKTIEIKDSGRTIVLDGQTYELNDKEMICVAFIGVDNEIDNRSIQSMGDSINIIGFNTETGEMSIIAVSRDTMADVNVYSDQGKFIDTEQKQLAYAYSFGNRDVSGGENTAKALTKLLFGFPVNFYFAINLDALVTLNDAIGGVTVTASSEIDTGIRTIQQGETVTLHGTEVTRYVRSRDTNVLDSNNARMKRQQEYIRAFMTQVVPAIKKDWSLIRELYDIIKSNSDTNYELPDIIYLGKKAADKLRSSADIEYYTLEGETKKGEEYTEYHVDDKNVLEVLVKVFYKPVSS